MLITPHLQARAERSWTGSIALSEFTRLQSEFQQPEKAKVDVSLDFFMDDERRIRMKGRIKVDGDLVCQRCLNSLKTTLEIEIDVCILYTSVRKRIDTGDLDVIECEKGPIHIVNLIEDDLLLGIPWKACTTDAECLEDTKNISEFQSESTVGITRPFKDLGKLLLKGK